MATNKHAQIRYQALDKCFSNFARKYFMGDLIEACSKAIYDFTGIGTTISRRQIYDDISYMESEEGFAAPILRLADGKKKHYRYEDLGYSINQQPISPTEINQLKDTIYMLNRFTGLPQFDWMHEVLVRFESSFNLKGDISNVVSFQENPDLKGLYHFTELFNAIVNKQVLRIKYKSFTKPLEELILHPYHLKQYNNRWFLFGYKSGTTNKDILTNLPLDRIESFSVIGDTYIENLEIDYLDYFYDVVGVTIPNNSVKERIVLKIKDDKTKNYIETKPLHASQKISRNDDYFIVELNLILNYEFETVLLGYANEVEVIEPSLLRENIRERANCIIRKNA